MSDFGNSSGLEFHSMRNMAARNTIAKTVIAPKAITLRFIGSDRASVMPNGRELTGGAMEKS